MDIAGIIAEYNPFHKGHEYHIRRAKELSGAEGVICVMSGSFVQRGEPAMADKYRRTRAALAGGADLVLELAPAYATGSAELFARGAVKTLAAAGCVNKLCFGVETEEPRLLLECVRVLTEDAALQMAVKDRLRVGLAYPRAVAGALEMLYPRLAEVLKTPNNLLAVEYLKAIRTLGLEDRLEPVPVLRKGQAYNSASLEESPGNEANDAFYASASAIRKTLASGVPAKDLSEFMTAEMVRQADYFLDPDALSQALAMKLLALDHTGADLTAYEDVSPDLAARIRALHPYNRSFAELTEEAATRAFSTARVQRALLHIFLDVKKGDGAKEPECLKILGLKSGSPVPSQLRNKARLPLITKTADDAAGLSRSFVYSSDLYNSLVRTSAGLILPDDLRRSPVILP